MAVYKPSFADVEIPTGKPLILELGENLTVMNQYYLG